MVVNVSFTHVCTWLSSLLGCLALRTLLTLVSCFPVTGSVETLPWATRIKVAIGAARGLSFLNDECQIIYRDLKASNILLDMVFTRDESLENSL